MMMKRFYYLRLLHEGDLLRCFRNSTSVTYESTLPSASFSAPYISSFVQSLSTFDSNVREWHFVRHSLLWIVILGFCTMGASQTYIYQGDKAVRLWVEGALHY